MRIREESLTTTVKKACGGNIILIQTSISVSASLCVFPP